MDHERRATRLVADYLREQARWRSHKADEYDDDRNTQSGLALLDAAEYVEQLPDDDPRFGLRPGNIGQSHRTN